MSGASAALADAAARRRAVTDFDCNLVVLAGAVLGISRIEWCLVILCIAAVLSAELFNTSIERLAKTINQETSKDIRDALDMASGAVLVVSLAAAGVGIVVLGRTLLQLLS